jgi:hypothetical protein
MVLRRTEERAALRVQGHLPAAQVECAAEARRQIQRAAVGEQTGRQRSSGRDNLPFSQGRRGGQSRQQQQSWQQESNKDFTN